VTDFEDFREFTKVIYEDQFQPPTFWHDGYFYHQQADGDYKQGAYYAGED